MDSIKIKSQKAIKLLQHCKNQKAVVTTSAGATSLVLIDLLYLAKVNIPVVFINTGFLFKETVDFFTGFCKLYPSVEFISIRNDNDKKLFLKNDEIENTDFCCKKNKVDVIREYLINNNINYWISGPRREQTNNRKNLNSSEKNSMGIEKLYPLLDWTEEEMQEYLKSRNLPSNPLYQQGYESIGCYPCTSKANGRDGRWNGEKSECGLHLL